MCIIYFVYFSVILSHIWLTLKMESDNMLIKPRKPFIVTA